MKKRFVSLLILLLSVTVLLFIFVSCDKDEGQDGVDKDSIEQTDGGNKNDGGGEKTKYTATFKADGATVDTILFTLDTESITPPEVPNKNGYTGKWESFSLKGGSITVNAVYTPIIYTVTFKSGDETLETKEFTVESKSIVEPGVPSVKGYKGEWEKYALGTENITVSAVYTPITYTVTFVADGKIIEKIDYTVETESITAPEVPKKQCYTEKWSDFSLGTRNITVNAIYTLSHTALTNVKASQPQCNKIGNTEYYLCSGCDKLFSDSLGKQEIADKQSVVLSKVSCSYVNKVCKWCGSLKPSEGLSYGLSSDKTFYSVSAGSCKDTEIVIPGYYNGKPVKVSSFAFQGKKDITSVTVLDGVISIEEHAFNGCSKLASITLPDSVKTVKSYAFIYTAYYNTSSNWNSGTLYIGKHLIESSASGNYEVKSGTLCIAELAFKNNTSILSIVIPDSVISIGESAFYGCKNLNSVKLSNGVVSIEESVFEGCEGLTSVIVGSGVASIGDRAFYNCKKLEEIKYRGSQAQWNAITKGEKWATYYVKGNYRDIDYTVTYNYTGE